MYRIHFDLHDKPFRIPPSPKYLYMSDTHDESRARILYGVQEARGFVVVSGAIGLGKTTVLLSVLDQLDRRTRTAVLTQPIGNFVQLLRMTLHEFDSELEAANSTDEVELLQALNRYLIGRLAAGQTCVLMIDEAQNLSIELLEQLRMLSNLQTEEASLLQIILVGQPELLQRLEEPSIAQLKQRVGVWYEILPLTAPDVRDYIHHRLHVAGAQAPRRIIPDESCNLVAEFSRGVPRLINQICDTALVIAFGQNAPLVTQEHVNEAATELHLGPAVRLRDDSSSQRKVSAVPSSEARSWRSLASVASFAVVLAIVALFAVGAVLQNGRGLPISARGGAEAQRQPTGPTESVAMTAEPAPAERVPERAAPEVVESTPGARRPPSGVHFAVHVASFRDNGGIEMWLAREVRTQAGWKWPVYVNRTDGSDPWFRVLVGGFEDLASARDCANELKRGFGKSYALPAQLAAESREVYSPTEVALRQEEEAR
jgi:type II secretory pathway predicted ATPase ExeA